MEINAEGHNLDVEFVASVNLVDQRLERKRGQNLGQGECWSQTHVFRHEQVNGWELERKSKRFPLNTLLWQRTIARNLLLHSRSIYGNHLSSELYR